MHHLKLLQASCWGQRTCTACTIESLLLHLPLCLAPVQPIAPAFDTSQCVRLPQYFWCLSSKSCHVHSSEHNCSPSTSLGIWQRLFWERQSFDGSLGRYTFTGAFTEQPLQPVGQRYVYANWSTSLVLGFIWLQPADWQRPRVSSYGLFASILSE